MPARTLTIFGLANLALVCFACGAPAMAFGQTSRLPDVPAKEGVVAAAHLEEDLLEAPQTQGAPSAAGTPPARGFLQWAGVTSTWLPDLGSDDFEMTEVEAKIVLAVPCPTIDFPLVLTPRYAVNFLEGPTAPDLPGRLHSASFEFRWLPLITPALRADLRVMPGWYSDAETSSSDAVRIGARAVGIYTSSPAVQWVFGGAYLDRNDVPFLPIGGMIWTPHEDVRYELIFPQPKLARRLSACGGIETWAYLAGEFGGDQWAIERADGSEDVVTIRDLRLMAGLERKACGGGSLRVEAGYVLDRSIEYEGPTADFVPDDTLMLRAELAY
jgi:hypothetical protein